MHARTMLMGSALLVLALVAAIGCTPQASVAPATAQFQAALNNVSTAPAMPTSEATGRIVVDGQDITSPLAPVIWVVHTGNNPLFTLGEAASDGLEALAEDGDPSILLTAVQSAPGVKSAGVANTPVGASDPGPIGPGQSYQFSFTATEGDYLSVATMFVQSNDLFYAPSTMGIDLFNGSTAVTGDVTSSLRLWDAGTEVNQRPGVGADQAPRQSGPNTGTSEAGTVGAVSDSYTYPATADQVQLEITSATATGL